MLQWMKLLFFISALFSLVECSVSYSRLDSIPSNIYVPSYVVHVLSSCSEWDERMIEINGLLNVLYSTVLLSTLRGKYVRVMSNGCYVSRGVGWIKWNLRVLDRLYMKRQLVSKVIENCVFSFDSSPLTRGVNEFLWLIMSYLMESAGEFSGTSF